MIEGLVSTVVPVHNRPALLREAVESVLAQTYRPAEVVIVDDGSTDDTSEVATALERANPGVVSVLRRPNGGPGAARETGRTAIRGEFVQYLDSDDLLLPRKFEIQVAALRREPECGIAYGHTRFVRRDGESPSRPWKGSGVARRTMFPSFLVERWWDTPTPLYRRSVSDRAGAWLPLRIEEDWEYDCRIAALGTSLAYCPEFVAVVRDVADTRLSRGHAVDPVRAADRCRAHLAIAEHARNARLPPDAPELDHFSRALFLLARQCGAAGLPEESQALFHAARTMAGNAGSRPIFLAYGTIARLCGWESAGKLAQWWDRRRGRSLGAP